MLAPCTYRLATKTNLLLIPAFHMNLATLNQLSISIQKFLQLKSKTGELNKACEKHYQLEQELAFHKIDSKFDSLGRGPEIVHMVSDISLYQ